MNMCVVLSGRCVGMKNVPPDPQRWGYFRSGFLEKNYSAQCDEDFKESSIEKNDDKDKGDPASNRIWCSYDVHMMFIHFPPYLVIACYSPGFEHVLSQFQLVSIHFGDGSSGNPFPFALSPQHSEYAVCLYNIYIYWLRTHRYRYIHIHYVYVCKLFFPPTCTCVCICETWIENKSSNSWCQSPSWFATFRSPWCTWPITSQRSRRLSCQGFQPLRAPMNVYV